MSNEQTKAKELAELLTAFVDGKQLEIYAMSDEQWNTYIPGMYKVGILQLVLDGYDFRIKPETKRIALTMQDLIDRELSGKTMRLSNGDFIWSWDDKYIRIINAYIAYDYLLESNSTFLDGTPCYKEMESE